MKNLIRIFFFIWLASLSSSSFAADAFKVGVVNMNRVYQNSHYFIGINDKFMLDFKPRQDQIALDQRNLQDENAHLNTMPAQSPADIDTKDDMQQKVYIDKQNLDISNLEFQRDVTVAKYRMMKTFMARYNTVIKKIAKDGHFTMIIQSDTNSLPYMPYIDTSLDVTDEVIKQLGDS
jgi:Skp family chaperone for outer membrane proteins